MYFHITSDHVLVHLMGMVRATFNKQTNQPNKQNKLPHSLHFLSVGCNHQHHHHDDPTNQGLCNSVCGSASGNLLCTSRSGKCCHNNNNNNNGSTTTATTGTSNEDEGIFRQRQQQHDDGGSSDVCRAHANK